MNTRILVTINYLSNTVANLVREDGSVFQTIEVGKPFCIGNQMRDFVPQFCPQDRKIHCRKFDNAGYVMEDVYLPRNKKVLWALTSGSARRGLFHIYREPTDSLDAALQRIGCGRSVISMVDTIKDVLVEKGGPDCGHQIQPYGYCFCTDAKDVVLRHEGAFADEKHPNQFHRNCKEEPDLYKINGGTFVVEWRYDGVRPGNCHDRIQEIIMAKGCDRDAVYKAIYDHYRQGQNPLDK